jgi:hypothetical protein
MKRTRILLAAFILGALPPAAWAGAAAEKPPAPAGDAQAKADSPAWKKVTYLGVTTAPVGETLGRQLKLPAGVGLVASFVAPDSPALAAGVRQHDVLVKFDDQLLIVPQQLAVLIHIRKPKDKVALTLIREGKEEKLTAELGETDEFVDQAAEAPKPQAPINLLPGLVPHWPNLPPPAGDQIRLHLNALGGQGGAVAVVSASSSFDGEHHLTLTNTDGHKRLLAKDKDGKVIFDGPVDTPEQLKAVPEQIRAKAETMTKGMTVRAKVRPAPPTAPQAEQGQNVLPQ